MFDDETDIDDFVQIGPSGPNRFERLQAHGRDATTAYSEISLEDAKYLISESGGDVSVRYHHGKGLQREDVEDISLHIEPDSGMEVVQLGPGTAALVLDAAVRYPNELELEGRRMDFTHLVEDYFEHSDDLIAGRGPDGGESSLGLAVVDGEPEHYAIEAVVETGTHYKQDDGSYAPEKRSLVLEGTLEGRGAYDIDT